MDIQNFNMSVPTWDNGVWTVTEFNSHAEFTELVQSVFDSFEDQSPVPPIFW